MSVSPLPSEPPNVRLRPPRFRTFRVIAALVLREVNTTYGRSPGGYLWAVLQPLGTVAIMAFAFSLILPQPPLGRSFILFYASGYLFFVLYNQLAVRVAGALQYSRSLLSYPGVLWIDAIFARAFLSILVWMTVALLVFGGIACFVAIPSVLRPYEIMQGTMMAICLGMGVGLMNCLLTGFFPVWERIWGIVTTPLMLASGVLFIYEDMPQMVREILWWNPLIHVVSLVRSGVYAGYHPMWISPIYVFAVGLVLVALGLVFLRRGHSAIFER